MTQFPCLIRTSTSGGEVRFALGDPLADSYLAFVAGRSRPNTLRAVAHDLKTFFSVIDKDPVDVTPADIFDFVADQRGDRSVVRISDGESGLSARTIARRLSSISGFYAYLVARGDTPVSSNPVPRGLSTRRRGGRRTQVPLVRVPRTLPKILSPAEVVALLGALRTHRDRAMVYAMVLGGLRRCEVLGLDLDHVQVPERSLFIAEGKGGHQRLRMIRIFLERLIEWDWPDAPGRNPILHGDIPPRTEPIPRFLTDQQAAAFMAAARNHPIARYRLVAQVLARTGLRASELCELAADAVTRIGDDGYWLRVPVGKLRNDRMIPLHAETIELFAEWTATNAEHIRSSRRLLADDHAPIDRRTVHRIVSRIGKVAGIDDMHPHRLRHTLATQAINRGMRLEAIATLLGHRSLEMTLVYAKITDRVVADEYASVCEQIDALYNTAATPGALPAEIETKAMARLRQESHARMLGNGMCARPVELDCRMETICETCAYFDTGPDFVPVLLRQRDHAKAHRQHDRAKLYDNLITTAETSSP